MRIVGDIPHSSMKITIFKMDEKLSVKFENSAYEQIYKFKSGEVSGLDELKTLINEEFMADVLSNFDFLHQTKIKHIRRIPSGFEDEFEKII